ncbi:unnamed protein product [Blepharisma stoltei]|uniref:Uncharacterized protein n=1 Tax=Blepharisma stoltei TaxID=1481888 RepID=A0AAU9JYE6_9CILI|nr:unnamed protein product [Blepharisma stoltei]
MSALMKAYEECFRTSLYNITKKESSNLCIYNIESQSREFKILKTSMQLDFYACVAQLPNGKLFCFGDFPVSGITLLIDLNGGIQQLPSGTPCFNSSAIALG